jgi:4-amino-4-deoxy-L-arabinose transferase-like glycosyltransferase
MTNDSWKAGLLVLALLAGLGVVCPLLVASRIPLVDPDEGLHASIAQEMVEGGDWTVPHLLKEPFLDKPILYFWAIAASLRIFGMSEAAVRLPGLLFGMFGTLTTAAIAWRILGRRIGVIAGLFYASMVLPLVLVQLPAHDVALVPWVNLALLCFWESEGGGSQRRTWAWTAAAGAMLGLAILTKGLAGVALVGIAFGGYLIVSRRLRRVHCFRAGLALTVAAVIGSSWYLAVEHANPGYLRYYFFERHVLGFLTNTQPHGGAPWWYYLPILVFGGIPWVGYLPVLVQDAVSRWWNRVPAVTDAGGNRPLLLVGCWFAGCTLFLTVSSSKLVTYIWPVFPAMAILAAIVWERKIDGVLSDGAKRWMGRIVWFTCLIGPLALPVTFAVTQIALPTQFSMLAWTLAVLAALTSLAPLWGWLCGRDRLTLGLAATTVCGQLVVLLLFAFPQVAVALSGRDLADYLNRSDELPSRMLMAQERVGSVIFYLRRDLRSQVQLGQMANQDIDDPLPTPAMGEREWIAIPERHLHTALHDYDLSPLPYEQAGRFRLYRRSDVEPRALVSQAASPLLR